MCDVLSDVKSCLAITACPIDCIVTTWNAWIAGPNPDLESKRARFVMEAASGGGQECPILEEIVTTSSIETMAPDATPYPSANPTEPVQASPVPTRAPSRNPSTQSPTSAATPSVPVPVGAVDYIAAHNAKRTAVGLPAVSYDSAVEAFASSWAATLKGKGCQMEHSTWSQRGSVAFSGGTGIGENLAWAWGQTLSWAQIVQMWWDEVKDYAFGASGASCEAPTNGVVGHFTQVAWHCSVRVGCAKATCSDGSEVAVCNYGIAGNMYGDLPFDASVAVALGKSGTPCAAGTAQSCDALIAATPLPSGSGGGGSGGAEAGSTASPTSVESPSSGSSGGGGGSNTVSPTSPTAAPSGGSLGSSTASPTAASVPVPVGAVDYIAAHNAKRTAVGLPAVSYDSAVEAFASSWAATLKGKGCQMEHSTWSQRGSVAFSGGTGIGENLAWAWGQTLSWAQIVQMWWDEVKDYAFGASGASCEAPTNGVVGHFTQVAWHCSVRVGCAKATCSDGSEVAVCNYGIAGNMYGDLPFDASVAVALGKSGTPCAAGTAQSCDALIAATPLPSGSGGGGSGGAEAGSTASPTAASVATALPTYAPSVVDDPCPWPNDGACDVPMYCVSGDFADCASSATALPTFIPTFQQRGSTAVPSQVDPCPWPNDGECDVPLYCQRGDFVDCGSPDAILTMAPSDTPTVLAETQAPLQSNDANDAAEAYIAASQI